MVALHQQYQGQGLGIVGISLDQDYNSWKQATQDLRMAWEQYSDLRGWDDFAAKTCHVTSIPYTIVVDQQGHILAKGLRGQQLQQFVAAHLK